jgi:copper chaperone CopZ
VEAALVKVDGFKSVKVSVPDKQAVVTYDPKKTDPQKLVKAINDNTTFTASVPKK